MAVRNGVLAITEDLVLPVSIIPTIARELQIERERLHDTLVITQASLLNRLPVKSASMDIVVAFSKSLEFPSTSLFEEISRVLKPSGVVLVNLAPHTTNLPSDKTSSSLERKLLVAGLLEPEIIPQISDGSSDAQTLRVKAKKPSWKRGSSFSIKVPKALPKVQISDDSDLIDEDSLLTVEDLIKPQLPLAGDCEVGSTRKACKNCTCGRAEAEQKVEKLLTMEQLNNPQSACGSCGLGDAFRCSTCPYKGLPPFKLGEKVREFYSSSYTIPPTSLNRRRKVEEKVGSILHLELKLNCEIVISFQVLSLIGIWMEF